MAYWIRYNLLTGSWGLHIGIKKKDGIANPTFINVKVLAYKCLACSPLLQ